MDLHNESELIRELKRSSSEAFDSLYEIYFPKVYSYCLQISKSPQKAADITQDVFMKLWEHRHTLRSKDSISPFIFKAAKNHLISAYRETINSKLYEDYVLYTNNIVVEKGSPLEYREFLSILHSSLDELPVLERDVVMLSRFQMVKNSEIAKRLGLSEQTVKNRLVLGIKHLRELLNKYNHLSILYLFLHSLFS